MSLHLFTAHPAAVGESYAEHLAAATGFGGRMIFGGFACLLHGRDRLAPGCGDARLRCAPIRRPERMAEAKSGKCNRSGKYGRAQNTARARDDPGDMHGQHGELSIDEGQKR